jgi:hypothetical protein
LIRMSVIIALTSVITIRTNVITTRSSVILTRKRLISTCRVRFPHAEWDFTRRLWFPPHKNSFDTCAFKYDTHAG